MSDNKTPLTNLLILINDRLDRLKLNENIDSETYGFILDESDWYKQKIKDLMPVEEEAIKEIYSDGRKSVLNSNPEIAFGTSEKYFNQKFKPE